MQSRERPRGSNSVARCRGKRLSRDLSGQVAQEQGQVSLVGRCFKQQTNALFFIFEQVKVSVVAIALQESDAVASELTAVVGSR